MMGRFARLPAKLRVVAVAAAAGFGVASVAPSRAAAASVAPARAAAEQSFVTNGSVTYTWQGDPARGCAALGLCGVEGQLTLGSQGGFSSGSGGAPRGTVDVPIDTSGSIVRVADGAGAGDCLDRPGNAEAGGNVLITRAGGGRLVGQIQAPLSSGRCAGPRQQDLAGMLLPVRRTGGKRPSFDLRTSRSFAAGPFTGTLVSTLVVRSAPSAGGSGSVTSSSFPGQPMPSRKVLLERVMLRYRIATAPGALDVGFSGASDPFCAALDACGTSGTLALTLPGLQRTFEVQAERFVSGRVDARQALADFRRGRLHVDAGGFVPFLGSATARVAETFAGPGGWRCQTASSTRLRPFVLSAVPLRSGRGVSLVLGDPIDSDLLRTYCPGPSDTDVFGNAPELARTSIGLAGLLARHGVISLSRPGRFGGAVYVGTRSRGLGFSLTLEHVRAGTVKGTR